MTTVNRRWIQINYLEDEGETRAELLGPKHVLFKHSPAGYMASLLIDPPAAPTVAWKLGTSATVTEAFFERMAPIVRQHPCTWYFVVAPQMEWANVLAEAPLQMSMWNASLLSLFDLLGCADPQSLCVVIGNKALLEFTLYRGFEISFYGPEDLWREVSEALYGSNHFT